MSSIWFEQGKTAIRSYSAVAKGGRSTVKIEIDVSDPDSLGFLLRQIGQAQEQLAAHRKEAAVAERAEKRSASKPRAIGRQPAPLMFTHRRSDEI